MIKKLFLLIFPVFCLAQNEDLTGLLTGSTWNIAYTIENGERTDETDQDKIRNNWVKFNEDGSFETPGGVNGKNIGNWTYNPETNIINFSDRSGKYRAQVEEISDMGLLLNYIDNGDYKIGLIHYVYIPTEKSNEELTQILTSGKWLMTMKRYGEITDKTPAENQEYFWYVFNPDGTYQKSEMNGEEPITLDGTWFLDEAFQLNLDSTADMIYTVTGDNNRLILTSTTGGYNTIEFRKEN